MLLVDYVRTIDFPSLKYPPLPQAVNDNSRDPLEALANACAFSLLATMTNVHQSLKLAFLRGVKAEREGSIST